MGEQQRSKMAKAKTPAKKTPAKKPTPVKSAKKATPPPKKTPAKKVAPAKKTPAKKSPKRGAAECSSGSVFEREAMKMTGKRNRVLSRLHTDPSFMAPDKIPAQLYNKS